METKKIKLEKEMRTARISGLGELPVLFYGVAKKNGVKSGDKVVVEFDVFKDKFTVGSYVSEDSTGRKMSGFMLLQ